MSASLILHPVDPFYAPATPEVIVRLLREVGLIGDAWQAGPAQRYLIGEHFLQLITFMGCAPAIELAPPAGADTGFCHVSLDPLYDSPQFRADKQAVHPRCPACRARLGDWPERVQAWQTDSGAADACGACGQTLQLPQIDWRHSAGCARLFVNIHDIYPREALPTEALFNALHKASGQSWNYFYQQD